METMRIIGGPFKKWNACLFGDEKCGLITCPLDTKFSGNALWNWKLLNITWKNGECCTPKEIQWPEKCLCIRTCNSQRNSQHRRNEEGWHKIPKLKKVECLKSQQNSPQRRNGEGWHKIPKLEKVEGLKSQQNSPQRRNGEGWHKIPKSEKVEGLKSQQNSPQRRNREGWHKIPKLEKVEGLKSQQNSPQRRCDKKTRVQINKMQNVYILNDKYTLRISHWPEPVAT